MKKLLIPTLISLFAIVSCNKSAVAPSPKTPTASEENNAIQRKSNFDLLTAHPWVYYKYYVGYVDSSNLGTLEYKRGSKSNVIDLDSVTVSYNADGTVDEYDGNGVYTPGTWHFTDSTQTVAVFINWTGTYTTTFVKLDHYRFYWYYTDIYGVKRYGQQVNSILLQ